MEILKPSRTAPDEDYQLECKEALDLPLADLIDQAVTIGWDPRQVYKAVEELARMQAIAYEEDPDPVAD